MSFLGGISSIHRKTDRGIFLLHQSNLHLSLINESIRENVREKERDKKRKRRERETEREREGKREKKPEIIPPNCSINFDKT